MATALLEPTSENNFQWEDATTLTCASCSYQILPGTGITVKHCNSLLCSICISEAVQEARKRGVQEVRCPMFEAGTICNRPLDEAEVKVALAIHTATDNDNLTNLSSHSGLDFGSNNLNETTVDPMEEEPLSLSAIQVCLNITNGTCFKCNVETKTGTGILLQACLHNFCRECLREAIRNSDGTGVSCPGDCSKRMFEREIRNIALPEEYEDYKTRGFLVATKDLTEHPCGSPGCHGVCEILLDSEALSRCLVCSRLQCVRCAGTEMQLGKEQNDREHEREVLIQHYELQIQTAQTEIDGQRLLINQLIEQILKQNVYSEEIKGWTEDFERSNVGVAVVPSGSQPVHLRLLQKFQEKDTTTQVLIIVGIGIGAIFIGASSYTFISWAWPVLEGFAARLTVSESVGTLITISQTPIFQIVLQHFREGKPFDATFFREIGADLLSQIIRYAPELLRSRKARITS